MAGKYSDFKPSQLNVCHCVVPHGKVHHLCDPITIHSWKYDHNHAAADPSAVTVPLPLYRQVQEGEQHTSANWSRRVKPLAICSPGMVLGYRWDSSPEVSSLSLSFRSMPIWTAYTGNVLRCTAGNESIIESMATGRKAGPRREVLLSVLPVHACLGCLHRESAEMNSWQRQHPGRKKRSVQGMNFPSLSFLSIFIC